MREICTIAIDNPVVRASVSLSVVVLTRSPDGATLMQPLLRYCSHLFARCSKVAVKC